MTDNPKPELPRQLWGLMYRSDKFLVQTANEPGYPIIAYATEQSAHTAADYFDERRDAVVIPTLLHDQNAIDELVLSRDYSGNLAVIMNLQVAIDRVKGGAK